MVPVVPFLWRAPRRLSPAAGLGLALALLLLPAHVGAQVVTGRVVDDATGQGVPATQVVLLDAGGEPVARARAESSGAFLLRAPGPGLYGIRADRVGYLSTLTEAVDVGGGTTLEVVVRISSTAVPLTPLSVTARRQPRSPRLAASGFYERRAAGWGHHMDRQDVESRPAVRASLLLLGIRGVYLERTSGSDGTEPRMRRSANSAIGSGDGCWPSLWVDGAPVRLRGPEPALDEVVAPGQVEALEVYRGPAETPAQYGGNDARCGVIVVWTRGGR